MSDTPLDELAEELASTVAEIERDLVAKFQQFASEQRVATAEALQRIAERQAEFAERLRNLMDAAATIKDGAPGENGLPGPAGPPGETGERGPPGSLPIVKAYVPGDVCYCGEVVTHAGCTWQALKDTATQPDFGADGWILLAASGADAREGEVCGLFDESRAYRKFDVVTLDGSEFRAVKDAPGPCPGDGWRQSASKGKRGEKGLPGDRGLPGLPGRSIKSASLEGGVLIFDYSDGQSDAVDLSIIAKGNRG